MKAKLDTTLKLHCGQSDSSSFIGRKYRVQDTKYGHSIGEYDMPQDAEKASLARPYSKVVSEPDVASTPAVRDMARKRLVKTNPDIDAGGPGSGRHGTSRTRDALMKHNYTYTGRTGRNADEYLRKDGGHLVTVSPNNKWEYSNSKNPEQSKNGTNAWSLLSRLNTVHGHPDNN